MTDRINKLIALAEQAKAAGQYSLALRYLNMAIELAEEAKDEEKVMKCLSLIDEITGFLSAQKESLSKKTTYSLEKQRAASTLYSLLTGTTSVDETKKESSELAKLAEKTKEDDWDATTEKEKMLESIKHQMEHVMYAAPPDLGATLPADERLKDKPYREEKKKGKARKKAEQKQVVFKEVERAPSTSAKPIGGLPAGGTAGPPAQPAKKPAMKPPGAPPAPRRPLGAPPGRPPGAPPAPGSAPPPKAGGAPPPPPKSAPVSSPRPTMPAPEPAPTPMQPIVEDKMELKEEFAYEEEEDAEFEEVSGVPEEGMGGGDIGFGGGEAEETEDRISSISTPATTAPRIRGRLPVTGEEGEAKPKKIQRFGDVSAPMEMTVKKEYLINIGLRVFKTDVVGMPVPMTITVPTAGPPIIEVLVLGQDFKVDQPRRSLIVPLGTDSDILNFRVTPQKDGIRGLTVEFYQEGTLIGRAILKVMVKKKKEPVNENLSSTSVTVASRFGETRLDATLRVVRYDEDFFFSLFTPRAKAVVSQSALFGKATVDMSKVHKLEVAMEEAVFDRGNPQAALDKLKELGKQIYNYIPKQIRKTIKSIEPKYLMIETGDLLVPWELAFDGDDFLCSKYCLGKRVFDETRDFRPPPFCIGKKVLDIIFIGASPKNVPEISVDKELELFNVYESTKRIHLQKLVEPDAVKSKVIEVLNKGDVVHLTCHGKYEEKEPLESALLLSDDIITADEIDDMEMDNWPLIFANACSTGAISDKMVGVGGIARAFLEAGAIAFLGPLFEIPDDIAIEFAKEFYNNLLFNKENIGEAILNTRKKLRDQFGGAFWAIFSLYGDPTLSLCKA